MFSLITQVVRSLSKTPQQEKEFAKEERSNTSAVTADKIASGIAGCFDSIGVVACIVAGALVLIPHTHTLIALSNTRAIIIMASACGGQLIFTLLAVTIHRQRLGTTSHFTIKNNELEKEQVGSFEIKKIKSSEEEQLMRIKTTMICWYEQALQMVSSTDQKYKLYQNSCNFIKSIQKVVQFLIEENVNDITIDNSKYYKCGMEIYIAESESEIKSICIIDKSIENQIEVIFMATHPKHINNKNMDKNPGIGAGAVVLYGAIKNYPNANIILSAHTQVIKFYKKLGFEVNNSSIVDNQKQRFTVNNRKIVSSYCQLQKMKLGVSDRHFINDYVEKKFN